MKTAEEIAKWATDNRHNPSMDKAEYYHQIEVAILANKPKWIDVKDRLPDVSGGILVLHPDNSIGIYYHSLKHSGTLRSLFTHWQHLPTTEL